MLEQINSETYQPNELTIPLAITYDNMLLENEQTKNLIITLEKNEWEYSVIRIDKEYKNHSHKVLGYLEFLKTLPKEKVVVLMDSRDVFCTRNSMFFMKEFKKLKYDIAVSLEIWCDKSLDVVTEYQPQCLPLVNYWKYHNVKQWPIRKYVNSGLIVGKVEELIKMLTFCSENLNKFQDDQVLVGLYMNNYPQNIYGDFEADLLHTSTFSKGGSVTNMRIQTYDSPKLGDLLGRGVFFLHFPSLKTKGQTLMYETVRKLLIEDSFDSNKLNELYGYTNNQLKQIL